MIHQYTYQTLSLVYPITLFHVFNQHDAALINSLVAMNNGSTAATPERLNLYRGCALTVASNGQIRTIPVREVTHISRSGRTTIIYTANRTYLTSLPLQNILCDLPSIGFSQVHKSHIVSLRHITRIHECYIHVGDQCLPLSGYFRKELVWALSRQLNQMAVFFHQPV